MGFEAEFVAFVRSQQARPRTGVVDLAAGDDCALLRWPGDDLLVVGVDQVMDGAHFDAAVHAPADIGRKAMNRNLSDCAAMAALPAAAVCTMAFPAGTTLDYAKAVYLGMKAAADAFDCPIVGGDTGVWPGKLVLTVTILGRSAGVAPVRRDGAKPGDGLYVTGPLGGSILGRHLTFTPRVREARELAKTGRITAMLDISDGLSTDLHRLCAASGVGATIDAANIPIHPHAIELARRTGQPALDHALHDGEDHEVLFAAAGETAFPNAIRIGTITSGDVVLRTLHGNVSLAARGWEHRSV